MRASSPLRAIRADEKAATIIEFAFVAPVFLLLLIGAFDIGHTLYMKSVLQGVVQKAARDSGLENGTGQQTTIDTRIRDSVLNLKKGATVTITRRYYKTFEEASLAQAEDFTDTNGNGTCDNGEPYQDENNNSVWDADGGNSGQGGAKDRVVYTTDVSYPRLLPLNGFLPAYSDTVHLQAVTVLGNQPYGEQSQYGAATVRNCPV